MTSLFLSPHLDDVVLSCAGHILHQVNAGARVVVATVFTHGSHSEYAARRQEDRLALESVGAEAVHLGLLDAPDRLGRARSFSSLLLGAGPTEHDADRVVGAVAALLEKIRPDEIWLPMGIGQHVDHLAVFACHRICREQVRFYMDRPYAFVPALVMARCLELEGGELAVPPSHDDVDRQLRETRVLEGFFASDERERCVSRIVGDLSLKRPDGHAVVHRRRVSWPESTLEAATELMGQYRSQLSAIVPTGECLIDLMRRVARASDGKWCEETAHIQWRRPFGACRSQSQR